jgi:hypothetical protein
LRPCPSVIGQKIRGRNSENAVKNTTKEGTFSEQEEDLSGGMLKDILRGRRSPERQFNKTTT